MPLSNCTKFKNEKLFTFYRTKFNYRKMYYETKNKLSNIIISAHNICLSATMTLVVQLQTHICVVNVIKFCL